MRPTLVPVGRTSGMRDELAARPNQEHCPPPEGRRLGTVSAGGFLANAFSESAVVWVQGGGRVENLGALV